MSSEGDLEFKDRREWRSWLELNHATVSSAWVIIYKKHSDMQGLRYEEAVEEAVCYGWIDGKMNRVDDHRFRLRFTPRRRNSVWSQSNKDRATRMIKAGLMTDAGMASVNAAKQSGAWSRAYTSRNLPETPADLVEALRLNAVAGGNFQAFPDSVKLTYIYWVESAKRPETRTRRISEVVRRAEANIKPE